MMKTRILIIDDEPHWLNFVAHDLQNFSIVVARSEEAALAELEADQFELIIASSRYLDTLKIIAEKYANKRVVVTTISPTTQEALTAYRLGARRYFPKSFGDCDLFNQVKDVVSMPSTVASPC
jgi:DNA-binding NtrC family response regulator